MSDDNKRNLIGEIDSWRLTLNRLASDYSSLTEAEVLKISQKLDDLIVEYYKISA